MIMPSEAEQPSIRIVIPPGPEVRKQRRILTDATRAVNVGAGVRALLLALAVVLGGATPTPAASTAVGDLPILVVLAGFPDRPLEYDRAHFTTLIDRLVAYYGEVSSGRLRIVPHMGGGPVVTLPQARATYVGRAADLARDALREFERVAVDPADTRALAEAQGVIVFFAGTGRESHVAKGDPDDPWSNYTSLVPSVGRIRDACVIAETEVPPFSPYGVLCHEFGHLLGLPELYAPGGAAHEGIGVWGLMGQGTWLGRGESPPHLDAWSKARLGWVDVDTIEQTTTGVRVPAVTREPRVVRIPVSPGNKAEYYLLENRLREGADAQLPGEGLLVWHVDERRWGFRTGQRDPARKLLHLVEADGRGDLDRGHAAGGNRGDATDPWVGPPAWRRRLGAGLGLLGALLVAAAIVRLVRPRPFPGVLAWGLLGGAALVAATLLRRGPVCGPETPGMAPHDGGPGRVVLRNFSPAGPEMRVDVLVAPDGAAP
jgi:M6 family metalloprotease-like protein